jgi:parallel beta-helix repeat protein
MNSHRNLRPHLRERPYFLLVALSLLLAFLPQPVHGQEEAVDICPSGCRYNNIQQAINASSSGTTLRIGAGTYNEAITLRSGVSLTGAGAGSTVLSGSGSQPVISVTDSHIGRTTVVEGLSITGGGGQAGAGVLVRNGAAPTLRNLVIHGNSASGSGGGVAVSHAADPLLDGVIVRNNSAQLGSGLALTRQGRATVRNSRFENNSATGSGSAGAVYVVSASELTMQNSVVRGTSANNGGGVAISGGSTVQIIGGRIENNSAGNLGGGMLVREATLTVDGTTLAGNSGVYGGALSISGANVTLTNCTLQGNRAQQAGGAIRLLGNAQFVVDNCHFVDNRTADHSGGAIFSDQNPLVVRNSIFDGNWATVGAGIHLHISPNAVLEGNTFVNNRSIDGPAIYVTGGQVRLTGNTLTHNTAERYGGAVVVQHGAQAEIKFNHVLHNTAGIDGGGIIFQYGATGSLTSNVISFNRAVEVGGGMTIYHQTAPVLSHNRFEGNQAGDGAAIQIEERASPLLENNDFIGNTARRYGGAVVVNVHATPIIRMNTFAGNRAGLSGGAVVVNEHSAAVLRNNTIAGNAAGVAGGVLVMNDNLSLVVENYISRNTAHQYGGGIYLVNSNARVANNQIIDNQAGNLGGGAVILDASCAFENNLVSRNRASEGGAGIYISNSQSTLRHNTIADNGRNQSGDGLLLAPGAAPSLSYNMIVGNDYGIRSSGGQPRQTMRNSLFDNRLANYQGLEPGGSDLLADPQVVNGPLGPYYLAQVGAGQQANSPLLDACGETAQALDLHQLTTRVDGQPDRGLADIGFHFPRLAPKVFLPVVRLSN